MSAASGRAGFVLAGGRSTRMGRDKALLPFGGGTLVEHVAACVRGAAGNVTLIGPPEKYSFLGFPVVADAIPGRGPLGGLCTALRLTRAEWNLLVACDMPRLTAEFLSGLLDAAEAAGADCLAPSTSRGIEPLCAVYHRRVLAAAEWAILHKVLKMQDFVRGIGVREWPVADSARFENVNTLEEWEAR